MLWLTPALLKKQAWKTSTGWLNKLWTRYGKMGWMAGTRLCGRFSLSGSTLIPSLSICHSNVNIFKSADSPESPLSVEVWQLAQLWEMAVWQPERFRNSLFLANSANLPFFQLRFIEPEPKFFFTFYFEVSKWPKFNNRPVFSKNMTDLISLHHMKLCVILWVSELYRPQPEGPLHFRMILSHFL